MQTHDSSLYQKLVTVKINQCQFDCCVQQSKTLVPTYTQRKQFYCFQNLYTTIVLIQVFKHLYGELPNLARYNKWILVRYTITRFTQVGIYQNRQVERQRADHKTSVTPVSRGFEYQLNKSIQVKATIVIWLSFASPVIGCHSCAFESLKMPFS